MRGGYFGTRPFGVPGWHRWCSRAPSGRVTVCVRGRRPARSPSAPRASLGASARSPARPCRRPRTPRPRPPVPSAPAALCRCVWWPGPAAAHGHRGHPLRALWHTPHRRHPPHRWRCVVVCGGQALLPPTDTAATPSGALRTGGAVSLCVVARPCRRPRTPRPRPPAPSTLRTHVVSCVADPGGRILIRTVGIVLREVSDKASPGPLQAFWSRGGYESMSGCDRASQAHTEAPGAVAPGALAAIRCELSEPNATRSVAA